AFEVQLSLTEKGQYAVAYGLSCKKDCHELPATDPRRTILSLTEKGKYAVAYGLTRKKDRHEHPQTNQSQKIP
ncbi:hypothetical protein M5044_11295, partial [Neisseria meningitidis]|nr:hypothetical protein [Neisseria meningitidis]